MSEDLLRERCVLVTGADKVFGRELAFALADAGADVGVAGSTRAVQATADSIIAMGRAAAPIDLDLGSRKAVARAFETAERSLGRLDVVIHASFEPEILDVRPLMEVDDTAWNNRCEQVIRSAIHVSQAAHSVMRDRGGQILFITPTLALSGGRDRVPLSAGAAGVRMLAVSAARQWGPVGITVNCVAPDIDQLSSQAADSPRTLGLPVLGDSQDVRYDIGPVVAMLSSKAARFVTGETIKVDGGSWFA